MYVYFGHGIGEKYVTKFDIIIFLLFEKKVETKNIPEKNIPSFRCNYELKTTSASHRTSGILCYNSILNIC